MNNKGLRGIHKNTQREREKKEGIIVPHGELEHCACVKAHGIPQAHLLSVHKALAYSPITSSLHEALYFRHYE